MENIKGFAIELDLDHLSVDRGLKGLQDNLKTVNSEMKRNMSAFDYSERSVKKYETSLSGMNKKLQVQKRTVAEAEKEYKKMVDEHGRGSKEAEKAAQEYNKQAAALNNLERYIEKTKDELAEFIRQQQIAESSWTKLGDNLIKTGDKFQKVGKSMSAFGKSYSMKVTAPIVAGGIAIFKSASDYESAFAGVKKTVDMSEEGYAKLSQGIRNLAKELPTSASEIAGVAEAAGQLGIKNKSILGFTRTVIDLGESTNLSLEQASTEFARFANIVGMSQDDFDRLGSSVVGLGNTMATTESEIMSMAMRLAAQGKQVGMTEAQIVALSGTMSSLGISAEAGGTAMTTVLKKIDKAVGEGGKSVAGFAKAANVSSKEFSDAWKKDPIVALDMFVKGLGKSGEEGKNLTTILADLGIKGIREADTILRMAGASDILSDAVDTSTKAWKENTALTDEAAQRYETTESKLKIMWNRIKDVSITLGNALVPAVMSAFDAAEPLIKQIESGAKAFSEMDEEQQRTILKFIAMAAAVGPVSVGLGGMTTTIGGLLKVGGKLSKMLGIASAGSGLLASFLSLGPLAVGGIAVTGLLAVGGAAALLFRDKKKLNEISTEHIESMQEEARTLEALADEFDSLRSRTNLTNDEFGRLIGLSKRIAEETDPEVIERLQKEYDGLREKSGLSAKEMENLITANNNLIEQAPTLDTTITNTGEKIVDNTSKVRDLINAMDDWTYAEVSLKRAEALEKENQLLEDRKNALIEIEKRNDHIGILVENQSLKQDEVKAKLENVNSELDKMKKQRSDNAVLLSDESLTQGEINELLAEQRDLDEKIYSLGDEQRVLSLLEKNTQTEVLDILKEEEKTWKDKLALAEAGLEEIEALNIKFEETLLTSLGINEAGEKGLAQLDEKLEKLEEDKRFLEDNTSEVDKQNDNYRKIIESLDDQIDKHKNVKSQLDTELGLQSKKTRQEEIMNQLLQEETEHNNLTQQSLRKQGDQMDKNNKKTDIGVEKEKERTKEAGKDVDKNVTVKDNGTVNDLNKRATEAKNKRVSMVAVGVAALNKAASDPKKKNVNLKAQGLANINSLASRPVTKTINFRAGRAVGTIGIASLVRGYAKGTPAGGHPGGLAVVGDGGGSELVTLPSGRAFLSPSTDTLLDLPKGTHVTPHLETNRILKSIRFYAEGTPNFGNSDFTRLLMANSRMSDSAAVKTRNRSADNSNNDTSALLKIMSEQNEHLKKSNELLLALLGKDLDLYKLNKKVDEGINNVSDRRRAAVGG